MTIGKGMLIALAIILIIITVSGGCDDGWARKLILQDINQSK